MVTVVLPDAVQMEAVTVVVESTAPVAVRRPVAVPMEATELAFVEPSALVVPPVTDQATWVVRSMVVVEPPATVKFPVAVYCCVPPRGTTFPSVGPVTVMEVRISTARLAVPDAPPAVAVMMEVPPSAVTAEAPEARPVVSMVAAFGFEELQPARLLISFWLPSL